MVRLELLRPEHAAEMLEGLSAVEGYHFIPDEPPADLVELTRKYERQARGRSDDGTELWCNWIIRDAATYAALGYTQATIRDRSALIGYHVFPSFWRSGVGHAALSETLNELFSREDVDRVWALVDTRNTASIALLKKLGFLIVGRREEAEFFKGEVSDEWEFELARLTWRRNSR